MKLLPVPSRCGLLIMKILILNLNGCKGYIFLQNNKIISYKYWDFIISIYIFWFLKIFIFICFLVAPVACRILVPQPRIQPVTPALEAWSHIKKMRQKKKTRGSFSLTTRFTAPFFFFEIVFFLFLPRGMWGPSSPDQGSNLTPVPWKCGILTAGLPGKSLEIVFLCHFPFRILP